MAVTRTADTVGATGEECQTDVELSGSSEDYWGEQKSLK